MKAEMNQHGVITIKPDNEVEAYALECWVGKNSVCNDNDEPVYFKPSAMIVKISYEPTEN